MVLNVWATNAWLLNENDNINAKLKMICRDKKDLNDDIKS